MAVKELGRINWAEGATDTVNTKVYVYQSPDGVVDASLRTERIGYNRIGYVTIRRRNWADGITYDIACEMRVAACEWVKEHLPLPGMYVGQYGHVIHPVD